MSEPEHIHTWIYMEPQYPGGFYRRCETCGDEQWSAH